MSQSFQRGIDKGLTTCHTCGLTVKVPAAGNAVCPRCDSELHIRKPDSISKTWALLITAIILYIPANTEPVMRTQYFGSESRDTIMSGVIYFLQHGDWPLALIIFVASVMVPLLKMLSLAYLLFSVQRRSVIRKHERTRLYRITELIGRWSMVDVFVVALLAALVQMDALATILPGTGAIAFTAVVILTMIAAMTFDPRLIWDHQEELIHDQH
jgi:paraquat-inducible protein A